MVEILCIGVASGTNWECGREGVCDMLERMLRGSSFGPIAVKFPWLGIVKVRSTGKRFASLEWTRGVQEIVFKKWETDEFRMVIIFRACGPIFCRHALLISIFGAKANHILLNYRCPIKMSNPIRHVYLTQLLVYETCNL